MQANKRKKIANSNICLLFIKQVGEKKKCAICHVTLGSLRNHDGNGNRNVTKQKF